MNLSGGGILLKTFKGGLHVPDHKENTNKIPIRKIDGAPIHIFPLRQHIGATLEPKVAVGDCVKIGDVLAESTAFLSVPVHASISGKVIDIKPYFHPSGVKTTAIFVENDNNYEISENITPYDINSMSRDDIIKAIKDSGVVGMGGAGFPTYVKLSPPAEKKVTHLIINAAECEPYLTSDHRRLLEQGKKVIEGLKICLRLFDLDKGYIGIEANKPDAIAALKALNDDKVEIVPLKTKYPQGSEKHLIKAVSGREVPSGGLPVDVGAIVMNVDTVYQIAETFETGMPLISRIITVAGDAVKIQGPFLAVAVNRADPRGRNAEYHHGAGDRLFPGDHFQRAVLAIDFDHCVSVGAVVGFGHKTLSELFVDGHIEGLGLAADADEGGQAAVLELFCHGVGSIDDGNGEPHFTQIQKSTHRGEIYAFHFAEIQAENGIGRHRFPDGFDGFLRDGTFDENTPAFRAKSDRILHKDILLYVYKRQI